jgi:hypothetical protein
MCTRPEMNSARSYISRDTRHLATLTRPRSDTLNVEHKHAARARARTMELRESPDPATPFLDTVEGEISFFRSIMRARPIGLHRHFHVLSMRTAIHQDTGRYVSIDDIWEKLRSCYNVDALESLVCTRKFSVLRTTPPDIYLIIRTPRGSNRQGQRIPHRASSTRPPPQTTSLCTPISARSSPFRTTKH